MNWLFLGAGVALGWFAREWKERSDTDAAIADLTHGRLLQPQLYGVDPILYDMIEAHAPH